MLCERLELDGDPRALAAALRSLVDSPQSVSEPVAEIIAAVRDRGDDAIVEYTRRFDTAGAPPRPLRVLDAELDRAAQALPGAVAAGLRAAIGNVERVSQAWLHADRVVAVGGHAVCLREAPVQAAAVYVPGGRAPYPSTVVMGVVPACVAGVGEIAVCAPPGPDGDLDPVVLGACRLAGASAVYRMGGAQAIAALAYGTDSVTTVEVIVGPGNLYVQEAKRQVFGQVGIDGLAGPTDLVLIAGDDVQPGPLGLDLLAQAEHGAGTLVIGISSSARVLAELEARLEAAPETGAVARLVKTQDAVQALDLAQALAPEHLQLVGAEVEALADRATRAGCVFVGAAAGTAFGDYIAGSSHILPTGGAARYSSGVTPSAFRRTYAEVRIPGAAVADLARAAAPVARAEGFELHARSMEARISDNDG